MFYSTLNHRLIIGLLVLIFCSYGFSQTQFSQNQFISATDNELTIKKIILQISNDNVGGTYSNSAKDYLENLILKDGQWSLLQSSSSNKNQEVYAAILALDIRRTPKGLFLNMQLKSNQDQTVFLQETNLKFEKFSVKEVLAEIEKLYSALKRKMPYSGLVLSRRGLNVTINLGSLSGLKIKDRLPVVQILKIHRHPRLQFIVKTEKVIIGQIELFKVDTMTSFGRIITEQEAGVIVENTKVLAPYFVEYSPPVYDDNNQWVESLTEREDRKVSLGEQPQVLQLKNEPQFGQVYFLAGPMQVNLSSQLANSTVLDGSDSLAPLVVFGSELWITSKWAADFNFKQGLFKIKNDLPGSSPGELDATLQKYEAKAIAKFYLNDDFFGPQLHGSVGFFQTDIDLEKSNPVAFTSANYSGVFFGIKVQFDISQAQNLWLASAEMKYAINPSGSDNPSTGSASVSSAAFIASTSYFLNKNLAMRGQIEFESMSIETSRSTTYKIMNYLGGIDYLF